MRKFLSDILVKASLGVEQNAYVLGYVGIGTDSASQKLEVSGGDALIRNAFIGLIGPYGANYASFSHTSRAGASKYSFLSGNAGDTYVNSSNGQPVYFRHENIDNVIITADGKLGIGTTSPAYKLHVSGAAYINETLFVNQLTTIEDSLIVYDNVGIGTTTPTSKLDVVGDNNVLVVSSKTADTSLPTKTVATFNGIYNNGSNGHNLYVNSTAELGPWEFNITKTWGGLMTFGVSSDGTPRTRLLSLGSDGNVGIGTTSPLQKLHVAGNIQMDSGLLRFPTGVSKLTLSNVGGWWNSLETRGINLGDWSTNPDYGDVRVGDYDFDVIRTDNTNLLKITNTGNVGIGTTSPSSKLEVSVAPSAAWINLINANETAFRLTTFNNGTNNGSSTYAFKYGLYYATTENATITFYRGGSSVGGFLTFTTDNGNERMRIDASGNVGIGTTSPAYKTEVSAALGNYWNGTSFTGTTAALAISNIQAGGYDPNLLFRQADSAGTVQLSGGLGMVGTGPWTSGNNSSQVSDMYFLVRNNSGSVSERMRITSAGNVGIGTTTPNAKLEVVGNTYLRGGALYVDTIAGYTGNVVNLQSATNLVLPSGNVGIRVTNPTVSLSIGASAYDGNPLTGLQYAQVTGGGRLDLMVQTWGTGSDYGLTTGLSVVTPGFDTKDVRVGIGTTSPSAKLDVNGNARFAGGLLSDSLNATTYPYNLTLGTSGADAGSVTMTAGSTYGYNSSIYVGGGSAASNPNTIVFTTASLERARIDSSGNLGIGTTNTKQKLIVEGVLATKPPTVDGYYSYLKSNWNEFDAFELGISENGYSGTFHKLITSSNYYFGSTLQLWTADTERMRINASGNVGIGTTSPAYKLDVSGIIRSTSDIIGGRFYTPGFVIPSSVKGLFNNENYSGPAWNNASFVSGNGATGVMMGGDAASYTYGWIQGVQTDNGAAKGLYLNPLGGLLYFGGAANFYDRIVFKSNIWNISDDGYNRLYFSTNARTYFGSGNGYEWRNNADVNIASISNAGNLDILGTSTLRGNVYTTGENGIELTWSGNDINDQRIGRIRPISTPSQNPYAGGLAFDAYKYNGSFYDFFEAMRIAGSGNVGIGTNNPQYKLHVAGNGAFTGVSVTNPDTSGTFNRSSIDVSSNQITIGITAWGQGSVRAGTAWLQTVNNWPLVLGVNDAEVMRLATSGNVGIGTSGPTDKLHIVGNTNVGEYKVYNGSLNNSAGFELAGSRFNIHGYNGITFNSSAAGIGSMSERMRITPDGNVGIGTDSPGYKLDVIGSARVSDTLFVNTTANRGKLNIIGYDNGGINIIDQRTSSSGIFYSSITFRDYYDSVVAASINFYHNQYFGSGVNRLGFSFEGSERLTILRSGNVGIGTTSPGKKLVVAGASSELRLDSDSDVSTIASRSLGGASDKWLLINPSGGNVGIGTTSPAAKLHIAGNLGSTVGGGNSAIKMTNTDTGNFASISAGIVGITNSGMEFSIDGSRAMVISGYGNVGIGTTSPAAKLDIIPASQNGINITRAGGYASIYSSNDFVFETDSIFYFGVYTPRLFSVNGSFYVTTSGNVGIGTTNPSTTLEIFSTDTTGTRTNPHNVLTITAENGSLPYNGFGGGIVFKNRAYTSGIVNSSRVRSVINNNSVDNFGGSIAFDVTSTVGGSYSQAMLINYNGNVGIGTSAPTAPLDTNGVRIGRNFSIANRATVRLDSNTSDYPADILFGHTAGANQSSWDGVYWSLSSRASSLNNAFTIWRGDGNPGGSGEEVLFTILPNGNVGIGTTNPAYGLTVQNNNTINTEFRNSAGDALAIRVTTGVATLLSTFEVTPTNMDMAFTPTTIGGVQTEAIRIKASGNVGIGTTSPNAKLQIIGPSLTVNDENTYGLWISETGDDTKAIILGYDQGIDAGIITAVDKAVTWKNIVLQPNAGNVGIGTTSPSTRLQVAPGSAYTSLSGDGLSIWNPAISSANIVLGFNGSATNSIQSRDGSSGTWGLSLNPFGGNVGIGTTSPSYKLDVAGNIRTQDGYIIGANGNADITIDGNTGSQLRYGAQKILLNSADAYIYTANVARLFINNEGNVGIGTTIIFHSAKLSVAGLTHFPFASNSDIGGAVQGFWTQGANGTNYYAGGLKFYYFDNPSGGGYSLQQGMILDGQGNVGIGTTSPSDKLQVAGGILSSYGSTNGYIALRAGNSSVQGYIEWFKPGPVRVGYMGYNDGSSANNLGLTLESSANFVINGGNVGIGTTSPGSLLTVNGNVRIVTPTLGGLFAYDAASGGSFIWSLTRYTDTSTNDLNVNTLSGFGIRTGVSGLTTSGHQFYVTSSGNVGIGTTSPGDYKLYVNGGQFGTLLRGGDLGIGSDVVRMIKSDNSVAMIVRGDGNVGIGTTSPGSKLHVQGNVSGGIEYNGGFYANASSSVVDTNWGFDFSKSPSISDYSTRVKFYSSAGTSIKLGFWDSRTSSYVGYFDGGVSVPNFIIPNGNVGIGTTSPGYKLDVSGIINTTSSPGSYGTIIRIRDTVTSGTESFGGVHFTSSPGTDYTIGKWTTAAGVGLLQIRDQAGNQFVTINSSGNVGIGTASPTERLEVNGSIRLSDGNADGPQLKLASSGYSDWNIDNYNGSLRAYYGGTEYTRLTSSGNFGIGTGSPSYKLHVEGNVSGISIYASHDIAAFSDITVKKEVERIENAVDKVKELNGYTYVRTDDATGTRRAGVIAQEVQKVLPEVVSQNPDGTLNVAYANMIALLIEAVKEQQKEIDELKRMLNK